MSGKNRSKAKKSFFDTFLSFLVTLPGILTGIAAVIAAVAGIYINVWKGPHNNTNNQGQPTPSPIVSSTVSDGSGNCFEQEFSGADQVETTTYPTLHPKDKILRIQLTDAGNRIGAVRLKMIPAAIKGNTKFIVEEIVDSKCAEVEEFSNITTAGLERMR